MGTQTARLDTASFLLDAENPGRFAAELLGVSQKHVRGLWDMSLRSRTMAARILKLQLDCRFEDACALARVKLDETIRAVLDGKPAAAMCTCCGALDEQLLCWSSRLREVLTGLNLPMIGELAVRDHQLRGRKQRKDPTSILPFPMQRHIRKAQLCIDVTGARPRLTIHTTGSGSRLPIALWQRPVDVDLLREGLLDPRDLPSTVARQLGAK